MSEHFNTLDQMVQHYNGMPPEKFAVAEKIARLSRDAQFKLARMAGLGDEVSFATEVPEQYFPSDEQHNLRGDAMRHILLQAQLMKKYGEGPAKAIGWLHENMTGPQSEEEKAMDLANDAIGRRIGSEAKDTDEMVRMALEAIENGEAAVLRTEEHEHNYAEGGPVGSLDAMVERYTGMQPNIDRKALLPRVTTEVVQPEGQGPRHVITDVVAPQALYDLARAYFAPAYAASGAYSSPEEAVDDAINTALNIELGGGLGSHVAGPAEPVIGMAVKQRGGNWPETGYDIYDFVERLKNPLAFQEKDLRRILEKPELYDDDLIEDATQKLKGIEPAKAQNAWIEQKLAKYIRNEMATPDDPLRRLAGEGVVLNRQGLTPSELGLASEHRKLSPHSSVESKTQDEMMWENRADALIKSVPARNVTDIKPAADYLDFKVAMQTIEDNPWLEKIDPETPVNFIADQFGLGQHTGFRHMLDNLKASMTDEELPDNLRLRPDQLKNVSMEDAVRRSVAIDNWRNEKALRVTKEELAEIAKTGARLEAPSLDVSFVDQKGGKWIDLPDAIDKKGNAVCTTIGKAGGWCTMHASTAEAYGSGGKRLTTLLDADGRPHVQIQLDEKLPPSIYELKPPGNTFNSDQAQEYIRRDPNYKQKISQQVLDFLNSGEWSSTVEDLEHYGIVDLDARMPKRPSGTPRFMFTKDFNQLGFAEGGPVTKPNVAGYIEEAIREMPERTFGGMAVVGQYIFDRLTPEQQRALRRASAAGGDMLDQVIRHAAESPEGQGMRLLAEEAFRATEPIRQQFAQTESDWEAMGGRSPSIADNPLFDWADPEKAVAPWLVRHTPPNFKKIEDAASEMTKLQLTEKELLHGTSQPGFTQLSGTKGKNRHGFSRTQARQGNKAVYMTDKPEVANRFAETKGVIELDPYKFDEFGDRNLEEMRKALQDYIDLGYDVMYMDFMPKSPTEGQWLRVKSAAEIPDFDLYEGHVIGLNPKKAPRVFREKTYGRELDLTGTDIPEDFPETLKKYFEPGIWDERNSFNYQVHESSPELAEYMRSHGYGRAVVPDAYESGYKSYIVLPEYIGSGQSLSDVQKAVQKARETGEAFAEGGLVDSKKKYTLKPN